MELDICGQFVTFDAFIMKSGTANTVLTVVLVVVVLAGVLFVLQTIFRQRQLRSMQSQVIACQINVGHLNQLMHDAAEYGKTHPDINAVLQPFEPKPPVER